MPRHRKILTADQQIKKVKLSQEKAKLRMLKAQAPDPQPKDQLQKIVNREHNHAKRLTEYVKSLQQLEFMAQDLECVTQTDYQKLRDFNALGFARHMTKPGHCIDLTLIKLEEPPTELHRIDRTPE